MCDNCNNGVLFDPGDDLAKNVTDYVSTLNNAEALALLGSLCAEIQRAAQAAQEDVLARLAGCSIMAAVALQCARRLGILGAPVDHSIYDSANAFMANLTDEITRRANAHIAEGEQ